LFLWALLSIFLPPLMVPANIFKKTKNNTMNSNIRQVKRLMVANRGEIAIRVLRAASELRLRTIAIYTFEDRYSLHRYKADEAYQIGAENDPLKPYLDIEEILRIAKANEVDAIHPATASFPKM